MENVALRSIVVCAYLFVVITCNSQDTRTKSRLIPIEVQKPTKAQTDLPNFLHVGVEVDGTYFYHFGGQNQRFLIGLSSLDSIVRSHKATENAMFVVSPCGPPFHNNIGTLMDRLETLEVKEFQFEAKDTCR